MLGSTADSLFWMFRYIERAENTLCLIESGFQLYLMSSTNLYNEWDAILRTNSIRPVSYTHLTLPTNREV